MKNYEFKVGDKVDWNGVEGEVTELNEGYNTDYPLGVIFGKNCYNYFTRGGSFHEKQTTPCLKLIKSKKKVYQWSFYSSVVGRWRNTIAFYADEEEARGVLGTAATLARLDHTMKEVDHDHTT